METRKAKLIANKSGGNASANSYTFRATIPTAWIKEMGLNIEERDIQLSFDGKEVTIKKV